MAIERFQAFAVYKNHRHITRWCNAIPISIYPFLSTTSLWSDINLCRKFSIGWFLSSWTLAILFVMILLTQVFDHKLFDPQHRKRVNWAKKINPKLSWLLYLFQLCKIDFRLKRTIWAAFGKITWQGPSPGSCQSRISTRQSHFQRNQLLIRG